MDNILQESDNVFSLSTYQLYPYGWVWQDIGLWCYHEVNNPEQFAFIGECEGTDIEAAKYRFGIE